MLLETSIESTNRHAAPLPVRLHREEDVPLGELLTALYARKRLIAVVTLAGAILSAAIALLLPARYSAEAVIMPPPQEDSIASAVLGQLGGMASLGERSLGLKSPSDIYVGIVKSRTVADAIIERFGEVQARFEELDGYALDGRAREVLDGLGFRQEMMDGDVGKLSGGWKMRVALGRILLMRPDVMLLDEPSNHLDLESLIWLETFLGGYDGALLMTSHDREFMNRIINKVIEIDAGNLTSFSGDYEFYARQSALNEKHQQAQFERQQAMLAKEISFIERFKARASHAAQVQSRVKKLEKIDRVEPPKRRETLAFDFRPAPRSGEDVANLRGVHKSYGNKVIYQGLDLLVRRKERCCVLGVNGAGKSTLLKLVAGTTAPDAGSVTLGGSVKMGYFAQHAMDLLDGNSTVFETLDAAFPHAGQGALRTLAGAFGFSGDEVEKRCRVLSGGEKARLVMALMLYDPPNFLVLDEPTNHLDIATKEMLITALAQYEGTMLFVSHDRHFLAALSNRVLEMTPEGIHQYDGGYTEYVARTGHEAPGLHA